MSDSTMFLVATISFRAVDKGSMFNSGTYYPLPCLCTIRNHVRIRARQSAAEPQPNRPRRRPRPRNRRSSIEDEEENEDEDEEEQGKFAQPGEPTRAQPGGRPESGNRDSSKAAVLILCAVRSCRSGPAQAEIRRFETRAA